MSLFKKVKSSDESDTKKDSSKIEIYPPLLYAAWFISGLALIALLVFWLNTGAIMYAGQTFYVSDAAQPSISNMTFEQNKDGTYTAKYLGMFSMGTCNIEYMPRPVVNLLSYACMHSAIPEHPIIEFISPLSAAEAAGLKPGDVVISVNDHELGPDDWNFAGYATPAGEGATKFIISRDNELLEIYCAQSSETGLFGITYTSHMFEVSTLSFIDNSLSSKYLVAADTGHYVLGDMRNRAAFLMGLRLSVDKNAVEPTSPLKDTTETLHLLALNQDNYGLFDLVSTDFIDILKEKNIALNLEEIELAWQWEISESDMAYILVPFDGVTDANGNRVSTPIPVKVSKFNGKLYNTDGTLNSLCKYQLDSVSDTYSLSLDLLRDSNAVISDDISYDDTTEIRFLSGMSGSPIIQNDRLIGVLTSVDVTNPRRAYMLDAESLYMHYYNFATILGGDSVENN